MSKMYKRCPRCNYKTLATMKKCGGCGLDYNKFESATNAEAKSAFRMGEKDRVLYTRHKPSDISKLKILLQCVFGGWFGLHFFRVGQIWRGILQVVGVLLGFVYCYCIAEFNIYTGYLANLLLIAGIIWVATFIIWLSSILSIAFNRFKYPVSLPYSNNANTKGE